MRVSADVMRARWWPLALGALSAAVLAVLVWMLLRLGTASSELEALRSRSSVQDATISQLSGGLSTTEAQLRAHGVTPSAPPPAQIVQGVAGPAGAQGPGPSDGQVRAAVDAYLAAHPPAPGAGASDTQVLDAVTVYLVAHPPAPGPPPSDDQVAAAVAAYMAAHPPPAGPARRPRCSRANRRHGPAARRVDVDRSRGHHLRLRPGLAEPGAALHVHGPPGRGAVSVCYGCGRACRVRPVAGCRPRVAHPGRDRSPRSRAVALARPVAAAQPGPAAVADRCAAGLGVGEPRRTQPPRAAVDRTAFFAPAVGLRTSGGGAFRVSGHMC